MKITFAKKMYFKIDICECQRVVSWQKARIQNRAKCSYETGILISVLFLRFSNCTELWYFYKSDAISIKLNIINFETLSDLTKGRCLEGCKIFVENHNNY